jgi:hypothetical protein
MRKGKNKLNEKKKGWKWVKWVKWNGKMREIKK